MKKAVYIILLSLSIIILAAFGFVEFRVLFAGEFMLFNEPVKGFISSFSRSMFYLILVSYVIFMMIQVLQEKREKKFIYLLIWLFLHVMSLISFIFVYYVNLEGIIPVLISYIPGVIYFIEMLIQLQSNKKDTQT